MIRISDKYHTNMPIFNTNHLHTQNDLLMENLSEFYKNIDNLSKFLSVVHGESTISLRIIDWFVTNYAKKNYTIFEIAKSPTDVVRFKVYNDYKLKLKAYSKRRFDPFCRWERIEIPCYIPTSTSDTTSDSNRRIETTIGQLNFFKWAIENNILDYIEENYKYIEVDMNLRNTTSRRRNITENSTDSSSSTDSTGSVDGVSSGENNKTRKKREELSVSACKCIKKETVKIMVKFS